MLQVSTFDASAAAQLDWHPVTRRLDLASLFADFAAGAAERDVFRRPIFEEAQLLKERGFGAVRIPVNQGGAGITLPDLFALARDLATADPNIAHVFRNHFYAVEQHAKTAAEPFSQRVLALAAQNRMFGVAFSEAGGGPAGSRGQVPGSALRWSDADGAYRVTGTKIYSTGNISSPRHWMDEQARSPSSSCRPKRMA
ncbi:hypothetical protein [Tianweitania sp.]|uniref:hypothetical protein n=1 Tax=Tianweitania sp. TaxID=2021634 RepID=UPI002899C970|nr:hypothetical protein [Tianweitania sp.]